MKKKLLFNNKGFMLIEVIIVTVVVATIMVSLYIAFNRVYEAYDLKEKYTNIDAIYAIKNIEDYIIDNIKFNDLASISNYKEVECTSDKFFSPNTTTPELYSGNLYDMFCHNVFSTYKINKLYLVKKNGNKLPDDMPSDVNQTFIDYFDYIRNAVILDDESKYIFLIETYEISDGDKNILNKYAYLEVK